MAEATALSRLLSRARSVPRPQRPDPAVEPRAWAHSFLLTVLTIGVALLVLFVVSLPKSHRVVGASVVGALGAGGLVIGALLGFLFAFPRFGVDTGSGRYVPNTNLEQVSDWITKILVGLGLVQARAIAGMFASLVRTASTAIDGTTTHAVAIGALVVFVLLPGFFVGFVQARVALPSWFTTADQLASSDQDSGHHFGVDPPDDTRVPPTDPPTEKH